MPGATANRALAGTRFAHVTWIAETGSTNADLLAAARSGAREGEVLVADHQRAGRGRHGRAWEAPPDASLLVSILLRPPRDEVQLAPMAVAVAAVEAIESCAGVRVKIKWPNDLVWPGHGTSDDRKLAGVLAEADWGQDADVGVVVGIGINVAWPRELPPELRDIAIALNHITDAVVDREQLLIALLQRLDNWYGAPALRDRWRDLSATIGTSVRVEAPDEVVVGDAVDADAEGRLIVELPDGARRTFAVGDVVHVRPG